MQINREALEIMKYYREQGVPGDQQLLIDMLRELQEMDGGTLSEEMMAQVSTCCSVPRGLLEALVNRAPSLKRTGCAHRLEICGGKHCLGRGGDKLIEFVRREYGVKNGGSDDRFGFKFAVTGCMKNCSRGPCIRWDKTMYGGATVKLIRSLIEKK